MASSPGTSVRRAGAGGESREYRVWLTPEQAHPVEGVAYDGVPTYSPPREKADASASDRWGWKAERLRNGWGRHGLRAHLGLRAGSRRRRRDRRVQRARRHADDTRRGGLRGAAIALGPLVAEGQGLTAAGLCPPSQRGCTARSSGAVVSSESSRGCPRAGCPGSRLVPDALHRGGGTVSVAGSPVRLCLLHLHPIGALSCGFREYVNLLFPSGNLKSTEDCPVPVSQSVPQGSARPPGRTAGGVAFPALPPLALPGWHPAGSIQREEVKV